MSPELADFLTRAYAKRAEVVYMPELATALTKEFYDYLDAIGIQHCNFGAFELEGGEGKVTEFSGSRLPQSFLEEFTAELAADDYVLLKARELTALKPTSIFEIGTAARNEIAAFHKESARVTEECARHGIEDGVAIIGCSPVARGATRARFFGFAFAGDAATGKLIRTRFLELQIAAFALLDQMKPHFDAKFEGFNYNLSGREREILAQLARGLHRSQIAFELSLSVATVDYYLGNIRSKLQSQTLSESVAKAYRFGIL